MNYPNVSIGHRGELLQPSWPVNVQLSDTSWWAVTIISLRAGVAYWDGQALTGTTRQEWAQEIRELARVELARCQ